MPLLPPLFRQVAGLNNRERLEPMNIDAQIPMSLFEACGILESEGMPLPVKQCGACHKTIWRKAAWFECPDCGAMSTSYGGLFTHKGINPAWADECLKANARLDVLMGRVSVSGDHVLRVGRKHNAAQPKNEPHYRQLDKRSF